MNRQYLMETVLGQTRLAVLEDGALCELYYERPGSEKLSGNLYLGRVQNVLPGMNAAFVDIGLDKNAFLYAGDLPAEADALAEGMKDIRIERMVRPGQEILVQVVKEPGGSKGCRVSSHLTVPGRLCVLMPTVRYAGVSKKITDLTERARLKDMATRLSSESGMGVIARTAAEGCDEAALRQDFDAACRQWNALEARARRVKAPRLILRDGSLALRLARDLLDDSVESVRVDGEALFGEVTRLAREIVPTLADRIQKYEGDTPLFDLFRVDAQAEKRMGRFVWLKSGGSLVVDETEAMTVIDVNTGKFVGKKDLSETVFKLNCEAAEEIARLLRLRDIGGIIIVDFIDMETEEQRQALLTLFKEKLSADRNRTAVLGFTALGLVEMTRKKVRRQLTKQLMRPCAACGGFGLEPSHETTARNVARALWARNRAAKQGALLVEATEPVVGWLKTLGAPEGMRVYALANPEFKDSETRISPADEQTLSASAILLK